MATVNKDFRIKSGLVVEGANATVNGEDIITTGSSTDNLNEGTTNLYYTEGRAKTDAAELLTGATLTNITITGDGDGLTITAENGGIQDLTGFDTDDLSEGSTNQYFTNQRATDAVALNLGTGLTTLAGTFVVDDSVIATKTYADGVASTAQSNAEDYADGLASNYDPAGSASAAQSAAEDYADGVALTAENNAKAYADGLASNYDPAGSAATAESNANGYTDTAIANLVDGAPALLDTLNELAAAINDDESFAVTVANDIAAKQNTLTAGSNISIVSDTISVTGLTSTDISDFSTAALSATASAYEPAGAASTAETNANSYTDTAIDALTTDDIEEGSTNLYFTDARAVDALEAVVPNFTAVEVNSVAKQVATTQTVASASTVSALTWVPSEYKSAKLVVKAETSTHSQVSEVMITLDASSNVAITEFAIVYTDVELATVTADIDGITGSVRVRVTTLNASTDVTVVGTLLV